MYTGAGIEPFLVAITTNGLMIKGLFLRLSLFNTCFCHYLSECCRELIHHGPPQPAVGSVSWAACLNAEQKGRRWECRPCVIPPLQELSIRCVIAAPNEIRWTSIGDSMKSIKHQKGLCVCVCVCVCLCVCVCVCVWFTYEVSLCRHESCQDNTFLLHDTQWWYKKNLRQICL